MKLIQRAAFEEWQRGHEKFRVEQGSNDILHSESAKRIGFNTAKAVMREIMLNDTVQRLPEVVESLRDNLNRCRKELKDLDDRQKLSDPNHLRRTINKLLVHIERKILSYLNGNLEVGLEFPEALQTLSNELNDEEQPEWRLRELNRNTANEDKWRDRMVGTLKENPDLANQLFLGGKQVQRALEFFRLTMIDAILIPNDFKDHVANVSGYLNDGIRRENWEHAMIQITRVCLKDVSESGLNFIVKHIGSILRRLFKIALKNVCQGKESPTEFQLIPGGVKSFLVGHYNEMLWELMKEASLKLNSAVEPMYYIIDPHLLKNQKLAEDGEVEIKRISPRWYESIIGSVRRRRKLFCLSSALR
jgi:hypothetical protein